MAVVAAVATAVCLTASAAASASPSSDTAKAKAVAAAGAKGKPGDGKVVIRHRGPDDAGTVRLLAEAVAARLDVGVASAEHALKELFALADRSHGVDPRSAEFAAIAKELGVSPVRFEKALAAAKQALGKQVVEEKGKGKPGDGKVVIRHRGPDDAGTVRLLAEAVAARLDVGVASAEHALKELFALADRSHGVDPRSAEFAAIAKELGVSPVRFEKALAAAKQALGKQVVEEKGKGKPGDGKVVIRHRGPDELAAGGQSSKR
ncbi:hypothetical protein [Actinopolymorpha rutila]|uniref:Molybdenum-dependent DNA-binding transcriptional regulator ModE n=1 Tax=Actinopolymorpha rutila TaxID=446787 RepID=A0A852ZKP3_9ACTN|nr:hypothetical protein [Actinopolymorpha rutila]NYH92468.1 molybdenum-dependent DNA-binding transcriptional regulator ModE [Actinopolymorpha rutila]